MSFLLDPPALLLIGLLVSRADYLLLAFGDSFFTRGSSRKRIFLIGVFFTLLFWVYSALLYLDIIYFPWPLPSWFGGTDWMLNSGLPLGLTRTPSTDIAAVAIFATYPIWYYLGSELGLAGHRLSKGQRMEERNRIIKELVKVAYPAGGAIPPSGEDVDAAGSVINLLKVIPPLFSAALTAILYVFDSRFMVLALTGKWKRFVNLDEDTTSTLQKRKYAEAWESNPFLVNVMQLLRITSSYGYFTKKEVYTTFGYNGPTRPNDPPWYKAEATERRTRKRRKESQ
ncbi:MAG: hypothetical protein HY619_01760 [Thaumarchaeota archaeon]|nr:hypothetical protein [Nitrososphaerota archaeon]